MNKIAGEKKIIAHEERLMCFVNENSLQIRKYGISFLLSCKYFFVKLYLIIKSSEKGERVK